MSNRFPEPGEVRNPLGINNVKLGAMTRELNRLMADKAFSSCEIPGYEHQTRIDYVLDVLWDLAMAGHRWAVVLVLNRTFGRIPLEVDVTQRHELDLSQLTNEQLVERLDQMRNALRDQAKPKVVDGVVD